MDNIAELNQKLENLLLEYRGLENTPKSEESKTKLRNRKKKQKKSDIESSDSNREKENRDLSKEREEDHTNKNLETRLERSNSLVDFYPRQRDINQGALLDRFSVLFLL